MTGQHLFFSPSIICLRATLMRGRPGYIRRYVLLASHIRAVCASIMRFVYLSKLHVEYSLYHIRCTMCAVSCALYHVRCIMCAVSCALYYLVPVEACPHAAAGRHGGPARGPGPRGGHPGRAFNKPATYGVETP